MRFQLRKALPAAACLIGTSTAFGEPTTALEEAKTTPASVEPSARASEAGGGQSVDDSNWRSPDRVSRRNSAYTLSTDKWAFDAGALGVGGGDVYATIGASYGVGAGLEIDVNLAHWGVGLLNVASRWQFLDTRYVDLAGSLGFWYGNGSWFWIGTDLARDLIEDLDVINIPIGLTASFPVASWIAFDLHAQYTHAEVIGTIGDTDVVYFDAGFGVRQVFFRPGTHLAISDSTELELFGTLPVYTGIPRDDETTTVPFSETWGTEIGLRSRFAQGLFGSVRMHYGGLVDALYDAPIYPSFEVEYRL